MKIIIVGGGFGGLKLARKLSNKKGIEILLIDKFNYHQFQPLFYQVATAGLDASNISFPLRKAFQHSKNIRIRITDLKEIVASENKIITGTGEEQYDILVLATGADTNFFGNQQLEEHAFPMKSTVEALQLRYKLVQNFEDALTTKNEEDLQRLMNIVVVGGGPTGVEISGALAEMKKYVLPKDYPELDFSKMNIYLLEGTQKTLGHMSQASSDRSKKYLEKLGVKVMTGSHVKDYDGKNIHLQDGQTIPSATVLWAAGIKGNIPDGIDKSLIARGNRIKVDRINRVAGSQNIYAIGDLAYMETPKYPTGHPQVATVAIQQAKLLAGNLVKIKSGRTDLEEYEYKDKGTMATVGRNLAVVDIPRPKLHFGGWFAWMIWMSLHLMLILGVKNKFFVFINWLYNYFTYDQSLRLIFKEFKKVKK
ncbi:MAG TPA: FAD-dependent oxidoreductase [Chitinophagaceae bacterium]|jgi:NADH dehydrogenase|nr:FAD-dependent oxidoreductase [Chitinophagaceae bacterium]